MYAKHDDFGHFVFLYEVLARMSKYRGALHLRILYSIISINIMVRCTIFMLTRFA